ncbi:MAG: sigma-54 dependent transcriptional regulator [Gammaproteobacteria bacterium]|nr:sigma-54 dependent transcriptional regulator [Gammaproteobacteria bacterium]
MQTQTSGICLVEDDVFMGESLAQYFELEQLPCDWYRTAAEARAALQERDYCALVSDIRLPDGDGGDLYRELLEGDSPLPPTVFITGYGTIDQAVDLLKAGARDYITKPFEPEELVSKLRRSCPGLFQPGGQGAGGRRLGVSMAMGEVERVLRRIAGHDVPVLITGESGVGKEYAARELHRLRDPEGRLPFVALNCAAIPRDLMEAELFGVDRGAYTGAIGDRPGYFEQAGNGTLFLDEVGDMPLSMQAKLLRATQEKTVRRVGGTRDIPAAANLVWATNKDLSALVAEGAFREDLYFRISTVRLEIPPLRRRSGDIAWFARQFLDAFARDSGHRCLLAPSAVSYLEAQSWPGNVRELRQTVERAAIFNETGILEAESFEGIGAAGLEPPAEDGAKCLRDHLSECEQWYLRLALGHCGGRVAEAARMLGISRKNLWERMNRLGIERGESMLGEA